MNPGPQKHIAALTRLHRHIELLMQDNSINPLVDIYVPDGLLLGDLGLLCVLLQERIRAMRRDEHLARHITALTGILKQPKGENA